MATTQSIADLTITVNQHTQSITTIQSELTTIKASVANVQSQLNLILSLLGYNHQQIQNKIHSEEPAVEEVAVPEEAQSEEFFVAEELIVYSLDSVDELILLFFFDEKEDPITDLEDYLIPLFFFDDDNEDSIGKSILTTAVNAAMNEFERQNKILSSHEPLIGECFSSVLDLSRNIFDPGKDFKLIRRFCYLAGIFEFGFHSITSCSFALYVCSILMGEVVSNSVYKLNPKNGYWSDSWYGDSIVCSLTNGGVICTAEMLFDKMSGNNVVNVSFCYTRVDFFWQLKMGKVFDRGKEKVQVDSKLGYFVELFFTASMAGTLAKNGVVLTTRSLQATVYFYLYFDDTCSLFDRGKCTVIPSLTYETLLLQLLLSLRHDSELQFIHSFPHLCVNDLAIHAVKKMFVLITERGRFFLLLLARVITFELDNQLMFHMVDMWRAVNFIFLMHHKIQFASTIFSPSFIQAHCRNRGKGFKLIQRLSYSVVAYEFSFGISNSFSIVPACMIYTRGGNDFILLLTTAQMSYKLIVDECLFLIISSARWIYDRGKVLDSATKYFFFYFADTNEFCNDTNTSWVTILIGSILMGLYEGDCVQEVIMTVLHYWIYSHLPFCTQYLTSGGNHGGLIIFLLTSFWSAGNVSGLCIHSPSLMCLIIYCWYRRPNLRV